MKKSFTTALFVGFACLANAEVPGIITCQDRLTPHDVSFTDLGQFKFALVLRTPASSSPQLADDFFVTSPGKFLIARAGRE